MSNEVKVDVKFNPAYLPFFSDQSFYKILYGSAGSAKSYSTSQKIVKRCIEEKGHRVWAFRKVATTVEQSVYDTLKHVVQDFGVTHLCDFNKTKKTITFNESDSVIRCAGLDDEEKIKSIREVSIAWMEEMTEFDEQDFNQLDLRMRGIFPHYRELIGTFNPVSELHWIKAKFFDDVVPGIQSKLYTLHTTFKDNMFLEEDYIERLENNHSHDPNNYRVYVKGEWGKVITGMEFYKNFATDLHVAPTTFDERSPVHVTFDFNVVPYMTATIWQIKGKKDERGRNFWDVYGIKEILLRHPKNSTEDMCEELATKYIDYVSSGVVLYGDATGRNRKTSSKKTDWMIIDEMLRPFIIDNRVPRSNPMQSERNGFINRMFFGTFPVKITIDPGMKFLIEDLTHCLEDGERNKHKQIARDPISKVPVEKFGHLSDGMDYFLCAAFKDMMV
jgi:phage terminase large subunit